MKPDCDCLVQPKHVAFKITVIKCYVWTDCFIVAYCPRSSVELQLPEIIVLEGDGNSPRYLCNSRNEVAGSCLSPFVAVRPKTERISLVAKC